MEEARQHSALGATCIVASRAGPWAALLAIALGLTGCSNTATPGERAERDRAERENAQRKADIENLVNEARPIMAWANEARGMLNQMDAERETVEAADNKTGSK